MSGRAIGKKFDIGYAGTISRSQDCIISSRAVKKGTDEILFGQAVVLEDDNTVRKVETGDTASRIFGIAVREVKQTTNYLTSEGSYLPESTVDIVERGTVAVKCNKGAPTAGGKVFVRVTANEAITNGVVGEFEAEADSTNTIELTNAVFATGQVDANGIAEIKILSRNL